MSNIASAFYGFIRDEEERRIAEFEGRRPFYPTGKKRPLTNAATDAFGLNAQSPLDEHAFLCWYIGITKGEVTEDQLRRSEQTNTLNALLESSAAITRSKAFKLLMRGGGIS